MESLVIEKIGKSEQKISLPKLKAFYPFTTIKERFITTKIVGVSYSNRQEIVAKLHQNELLWLERQPQNKFDENAIRVVRNNQEELGYLNKYLAQDVSRYLDAIGHPIRAKVLHLTGSSYDGFLLGAVISFQLPNPYRFNNNGYIPTFDSWEDDWDF